MTAYMDGWVPGRQASWSSWCIVTLAGWLRLPAQPSRARSGVAVYVARGLLLVVTGRSAGGVDYWLSKCAIHWACALINYVTPTPSSVDCNSLTDTLVLYNKAVVSPFISPGLLAIAGAILTVTLVHCIETAKHIIVFLYYCLSVCSLFSMFSEWFSVSVLVCFSSFLSLCFTCRLYALLLYSLRNNEWMNIIWLFTTSPRKTLVLELFPIFCMLLLKCCIWQNIQQK